MNEVSEVTAALTADLIVDGNRAADPVISPDGRWVAAARSPGWLRSRAGGWWPSWPVTS